MAHPASKKPVTSHVLPKLLLTGFEPFGGETINPSWQVAQGLARTGVAGFEVVAQCLPTAFGVSVAVLKAAMARHRPHAVVCLGQAGGRVGLSLERVAINVDDAPIADNLGDQPHNRAIFKGAPVAYWSGLPLEAMVSAAKCVGVAAQVSNSAGTFVCNHVFYALMHHQRHATRRHCRAGFVHVPLLPEQALAGQPSMGLADMQHGLAAALAVLAGQNPSFERFQSGRLD